MSAKKSLAAIVMLGDVMLGRIVDEALSVIPEAKTGIWGDTLPLLLGGMTPTGDPSIQLNAGNLECAVTDYHRPAPKTFNFKLSTHNIDALTAANFRFVSLANNHSFDYYEAGMLETIDVLKAHNIAYAGVGFPDEASTPAIVEVSGTKCAFLSYSDHYVEWAATPRRRGINFIDPGNFDRNLISSQIQHAASLADIVIVFVHWGPNWRWKPSDDIRTLAHAFIDAGADVIFGHSAHHVQGIELWKGKPIIYGAGGFIDDYALDEEYRNDLGILYCLHLNSEEDPPRPKELELMPTKIIHEWLTPLGSHPPYFSCVKRAKAEDRAWLWRTMQKLCGELGTTGLRDSPRGFKISL